MTDAPPGGLRAAMGATASADPRHRGQSDAKPTIAEIYERHAEFVWRIVRRHGIPDAEAQDVMHEVFLIAQRRLPQYDGRASITTWLFHIARGVTSNLRRGRAREQARLRVVAEQPAVPAIDADPEQGASRSEALAFMRRFLAELDDGKRDVFELVELEGAAMPEVAESLGINLNTAYSRLRLARQAFSLAVARWQGQGTP